MLLRYGTTENGNIRKKAHIYVQDEHGISAELVDPDALWVVRRLRREGFHAYIVGGAVRDLLVGRVPKDFDVATDAHPSQIRRLFRSARLIGRRFRLVHVYTSREKYLEVTTFRSRAAGGPAVHGAHPEANNLFGSMEEDAERRDFTINALYYCPIDRQVIDYVGGFPDVRQRRLRTLIPAETSFAEDPVRMVRAAKYASLLDFPVPLAMAGLVRRMRDAVLVCSRERVTEEVFKILSSGGAKGIMELFQKLRLFETLFPVLAERLREDKQRFGQSTFGRRLDELDRRAAGEGKSIDRNEMFGFLFRDLVVERKDILDGDDPGFLIQQHIRDISPPLFPSKKDLAVAADALLREMRPFAKAHPAHVDAARGGQPTRAAGEGAKRPRRRRGRRGGRRHSAGQAAD